MWLGIAGLLTFWTVIGGVLLGIVAIVVGIMSKRHETPSGRATAGIVMGAIAIVLPVLAIVALQLVGEESEPECENWWTEECDTGTAVN